jgi:hypothetical protein
MQRVLGLDNDARHGGDAQMPEDAAHAVMEFLTAPLRRAFFLGRSSPSRTTYDVRRKILRNLIFFAIAHKIRTVPSWNEVPLISTP